MEFFVFHDLLEQIKKTLEIIFDSPNLRIFVMLTIVIFFMHFGHIIFDPIKKYLKFTLDRIWEFFDMWL